MKMITRCPACATLFKVVPDQLRLAGGWVRCGQCMVVFDAQAHLVSADDDAPDEPLWRGEDAMPDDALASSFAPDAAITDWSAPDTDTGALSLSPPPPPPPPSSPPPPPEPAQVAAPRSAPLSNEFAASVSAALPIPTRDDDLDRRHAKLMEALARLREHQEGRPKSFNAETHGEDDANRAPPRDEVRHRDAAMERRHKRGRAAEAPEPETRGGTRNRHRGESALDSGDSRPMIDFVLSEIGARDLAPPSPAFPPSEPPAFIAQAQRRAFWASPLVRGTMWLMSLGLALLLSGQMAVSWRDRLAAQYPGMTPLLTSLCHCRIGPWRYLDAVLLDSDRFVRTGPDSFTLAVTLRNNGSAPVATPALELALTNDQEQPLVRRVLVPADWGAPPQLPAHGEFNGAAAIVMREAANPQAVSNYRIAVFYP
jgi:predicted Zn finger-like uncharacterized protein